MLRRLAAVALLALLAACSGDKPVATATSGPTTGNASTSSCPAPGRAAFQWPAGIPANFPKPPGGRVVRTRTGPNGVFIAQVVTPVGLREGVLFVLKELPKAGYRVGRGDAEAAEADAPFRSGNLRGVVRLVSQGKACETVWQVAVVDVSKPGTPLLPMHSPSPSALPFG